MDKDKINNIIKEKNEVGYVIISDDFRVEVDGKNLTLQIRKSSTNKNSINGYIWEDEGYFREWDEVFKKLFRMTLNNKIMKKQSILLSEFLELYKKDMSELKKMFEIKLK